jgi:hypothetical protein
LTKTIRVFYMKLSILQISWWVYVGGGLPNFSYGIDFHLELEFLFEYVSSWSFFTSEYQRFTMKGRLGKPDRTCVGILIFESAVRDRVSEIMVLLSDFAPSEVI